MTRTSAFVLWALSVFAAFGFGWYSGVSNAARVAQGGAHFVIWLFIIAVAAIGGTVAYYGLKHTDQGRTPNDPMMH